MEKVLKQRLDIYLVDNGFAESRSKAQALIMEGKTYVNGQKEDKPGKIIKCDSKVEIRGETLKYVSRGGLKLEKAMNVFNILFKDKVAADIGSSTGGFTDLMLQNGIKKVYAIDSGTNQLDYKLRIDNKVIALENTNARYLTKSDVENNDIDIITIDVSFISLKKIINVAYDLLTDRGDIVMLVKPQFEAGREKVEKNGVVRKKETHFEVLTEIVNYVYSVGLSVVGIDFSPIKGPAGNIEFLLYAKKQHDNIDRIDDKYIMDVVESAHLNLD